jgi:hypothetical protein
MGLQGDNQISFSSTYQPTDDQIKGFRLWVKARQAGVTQARSDWIARGGVHGVNGYVLYSVQVNFIKSCLTGATATPCKHIVSSVIPCKLCVNVVLGVLCVLTHTQKDNADSSFYYALFLIFSFVFLSSFPIFAFSPLYLLPFLLPFTGTHARLFCF